MTTLCDSLINVITYLCGNADAMKDGVGLVIYFELHTSKYFQTFKFYVPTLGSIAKTDIVQLCVHFIEETMNLNVDTLNEGTRYHIFPQLNPKGEN